MRTRTDATRQLLLRPPCIGDAARMFSIHSDPRTNAFNPRGPFPDLDTAHRVLAAWHAHRQQYGFGPWAIAQADDPAHLIGFGGLSWRRHAGHDLLCLGYRIAPEAWGLGFATALARAAIDLAFLQLREPAVYALVQPGNAASIRVLEKTGFQPAGTLSEYPEAAPSLLYRICRGIEPG